MKSLRWLVPLVLLCVAVAVFVYRPDTVPGGDTVVQRLRGRATVKDRVTEFGPRVRTRLAPDFQRAGVLYPPQKLVLLGLKQEKRLEVYAPDAAGGLRFIRSYKVLAASGGPGPKLREGDMQVPEGVYTVESFNPNSAFHVALRVNYPNEFDRAQAAREGRTKLGGNIMIHGSNASIGCLAIGDEAAEDVFVLAAEVGRGNVNIILSPVDFRTRSVAPAAGQPVWVRGVYQRLQKEVKSLPSSQHTG